MEWKPPCLGPTTTGSGEGARTRVGVQTSSGRGTVLFGKATEIAGKSRLGSSFGLEPRLHLSTATQRFNFRLLNTIGTHVQSAQEPPHAYPHVKGLGEPECKWELTFSSMAVGFPNTAVPCRRIGFRVRNSSIPNRPSNLNENATRSAQQLHVPTS